MKNNEKVVIQSKTTGNTRCEGISLLLSFCWWRTRYILFCKEDTYRRALAAGQRPIMCELLHESEHNHEPGILEFRRQRFTTHSHVQHTNHWAGTHWQKWIGTSRMFQNTAHNDEPLRTSLPLDCWAAYTWYWLVDIIFLWMISALRTGQMPNMSELLHGSEWEIHCGEVTHF